MTGFGGCGNAVFTDCCHLEVVWSHPSDAQYVLHGTRSRFGRSVDPLSRQSLIIVAINSKLFQIYTVSETEVIFSNIDLIDRIWIHLSLPLSVQQMLLSADSHLICHFRLTYAKMLITTKIFESKFQNFSKISKNNPGFEL